jgi:hypothetical protein
MACIAKSYDTSKARAARTADTFAKQAVSMRIRNRGPNIGWFGNSDLEFQEKLRAFAASRSEPMNKPPVKPAGKIFKHGKWFDSQVELFFYEDMLRRGIFVERPYHFAGWIVDFNVPSFNQLVEIKSWYTAKRQGVQEVVSRFSPEILFVEENDAYGVEKVGDVLSYLQECSDRFKFQLAQLASDSAA